MEVTMAPRSCPALDPFDRLQDDLLELIFHKCAHENEVHGPQGGRCDSNHCSGAGSKAALPLVCRRWQRVFNASQLLHGTLNLNLCQLEASLRSQADAAALARLLRQRGQACRRLWLHSEGALFRMEAVLQLVSPQLQSVYLGQGAPQDSLAHLLRFEGLRCLDLPACAYAGGSHLERLSRLEELTLREGAPSQLLGCLASLPRLRLLSLTLTEPLPQAAHRQLGRLGGLEELHLYLQPAGPAHFELQPGALAGLTRLRSLLLIAPSSRCEMLTVGRGLPRLPALQELQLESRVEGLPPDLWACQRLTRLDLNLKGSAPLPTPAAAGAPAAGSARLPALRELRLARCRLPAGTLPPVLCQLSELRRLEVTQCGLAGCGSGGMPLQLSRLTNLEHLSLECNMLCTLPSPVAALPALRHLDLSGNQLAWLPPGQYLRTLETLLLSVNRVAQVPPVLTGAAALEVLDLSGNPGLELSKHDVDATLARMPRLALLLLGKQAALGGDGGGGGGTAGAGGPEWRTPSVAALVALGQALPHLQIDFEHTAKEYEDV